MDSFSPKLDKRDTPYLIVDEVIQTSNGVGEAFLVHDNVKSGSIEVWTGVGRKGNKITSYTIDTPVLYKWRTKLKIFTNAPVVYVTYTTFGDQVEADDINALQNAVTATDKKLNDHAQIPHGDMFANIYDSDFDGVVERADTADAVDWSGVRNKPATYPPTFHTHSEAEIVGLDKYSRQEVDMKLGNKADKSAVESHVINGAIHVTSTDKENWNSKETPTGAQARVDSHANRTDNPHTVTKSQVGLGNVSNVLQAPKTEFDTHSADSVRHITAAERSTWNSKQVALGYTAENTANRGKANGYASLDASGKVPLEQIPDNVVTQDELGAAGYGDMTIAVYDTDRDGVVDRAKVADGVVWAGVTGKPSTYYPSTHSHTIAQITSLQTTLDSKETPAGAQAKANTAEANAKAYAMKKGPVTWNDLSGT